MERIAYTVRNPYHEEVECVRIIHVHGIGRWVLYWQDCFSSAGAEESAVRGL